MPVAGIPPGPVACAELRRLPRECCRTPEELARLIEAGDRVGFRVGDKIALAAGLGLRARELAQLRWGAFDFQRATVRLESSGKSAPTVVALPEFLIHRIGIWAFGVDPSALLFPLLRMRAGQLEQPREVLTRGQLRAAVVEAGLPHPERWSPHSLRDTFITLEHRRNGGDFAATARASRHRSLSSLVRYLRELERAEPPAAALPGPAALAR